MPKTNKQKLAASRREVRDLRELAPQGSLRRIMGSVLRTGTAYGGPMGVIELQKAGAFPAFPVDIIAGAGLNFLADMRWLGGASDIVRETIGGHVDGRAGQLATLQALKIRLVAGKFVNGEGNPLPIE